MIEFVAFAFYLCIGALLLVAVPIAMHPTMPAMRKLLICTVAFFVFVPGGLVLYAYLGAPKMAVSR